MSIHDHATPVRHEYDSFPEPRPFWIATCLAEGCGVALNSGHHYTDLSLARKTCHRHNVIEHPLRAFGDDFVEWGEHHGRPLFFRTHENSAHIRYEGDVIQSIAVAEPRRDGMGTAILSLLISGHPGVTWRITPPLSPEGLAFWESARVRFPGQRFPVVV